MQTQPTTAELQQIAHRRLWQAKTIKHHAPAWCRHDPQLAALTIRNHVKAARQINHQFIQQRRREVAS